MHTYKFHAYQQVNWSQYQRVRVSHTATSHTKGVICPEVRIYVSQNYNKLYSKEKKTW